MSLWGRAEPTRSAPLVGAELRLIDHQQVAAELDDTVRMVQVPRYPHGVKSLEETVQACIENPLPPAAEPDRPHLQESVGPPATDPWIAEARAAAVHSDTWIAEARSAVELLNRLAEEGKIRLLYVDINGHNPNRPIGGDLAAVRLVPRKEFDEVPL